MHCIYNGANYATWVRELRVVLKLHGTGSFGMTIDDKLETYIILRSLPERVSRYFMGNRRFKVDQALVEIHRTFTLDVDSGMIIGPSTAAILGSRRT
ncbi:hypothetical protein LIER_36928 [Lithospermum erythrorhizon]|uniref:Retrotransposon Copia-like N-terminal domain-containing protein n=1 Tax=Lithospermum erythrorhizon TaxID=34254 RepID=A0AAV3PEL9_LITER